MRPFLLLLLSSSAIALPKLFLAPAPVFDRECSVAKNSKVDPAWYKELYEKLPAFQKAWDSKADALNQTAQTLAGRNFSRTEYSVSLVLCKWTPMATPFIVSARPYLSMSQNRLSMTAFVAMTHHELLHHLVDNIENQEFSAKSAMLQKYQAEDYNVLVHLHLMALQKAIYQKLNDQDLLKEVDVLYRRIGGTYLRTWDIINAEGPDVFVKELKSYNSN